MKAPGNTENSLNTKYTIKRSLWMFYVISFGIALPVVTLVVEVVWAWCAQVLFDPLPTMFHAVMIAVVPIANILALFASRGNYRGEQSKIRFLNGIAIGVSGFYTILFIPIMPIAAMAVMWGIGLLPLAPVLSLVAAIMCRRVIPRSEITDPISPLKGTRLGSRFNLANWGILAGLVAIIAAELPFTLTEIGMRMATSEDKAEQLDGVRMLRSFGDHDRLLSYSYARRGKPLDMLSFFLNWNKRSISLDEARAVYYRVTGLAFNDLEPVPLRRQGLWENSAWFDLDFDQGGEVVGKKLKDVQLSDSVIDGSIDGDAALAYLEWTFEFSNQSSRLAEARAQINLPPGAVVSRLTLWVNGEEREAAFAGRSQVRQAYEQVVRRQRDPVLVTTAGPDTVLVQLYPVPVGGKMKARIGITAPLILNDPSQAVLRLPHFKQRNFYIDPDFEHSLWLESEADINSQPTHLILESGNSGASVLREKMRNSELKSSNNIILVSRDSRATTAYAVNHWNIKKPTITQRFTRHNQQIEKLVIVVDGSKSVQSYIEQLSDTIAGLSKKMDISIIVAGDEVSEFKANAERLRQFEFEGGVDNTEALEKAWSIAAGHSNSAVLWLHGAQPVVLKSVSGLRQNWRRQPDGPLIYDFPLTSQVNRIAEALDGVPQFKVIPRVRSLGRDLSYQFKLWRGEQRQLIAVRESVTKESVTFPGDSTSDHLVRLWAFDRIQSLISQDDKEKTSQAIKMAAKYQLVTPVSGAVVLENQQQYDENGLQPVPEGSVPTIPEPETWLLIIATLVILSWVFFRQRRRFMEERLIA